MAQQGQDLRGRADVRLALGIVFGVVGAAALASVFIAIAPMLPKPKAAAPAASVVVPQADLIADVEAAVQTAALARQRADAIAAEADALARSIRGGSRTRLADGRVFEGQVTEGAPEGAGIMRGGPAPYAAGFWVSGVRTGAGVDCRGPDCTGASYKGDFRANAPTGAAVVVFPDGTIYRGDVRDGMPDGFGELTRPDGSTYHGAFSAGRRDGYGAETPASGPAQRGFWAADQLSESVRS